ncbi:ficolin-1-like [Mercenaria mercenaria]|uniref:ficolin-1-like n=1 Tax=Mercenaria mercenaria TaxID=6596 RepID=UPI00234E41F3|nr:ficolin-1-like [Mercenaria mercenaria]
MCKQQNAAFCAFLAVEYCVRLSSGSGLLRYVFFLQWNAALCAVLAVECCVMLSASSGLLRYVLFLQWNAVFVYLQATVFQNRFNGTVDFDRYIVEYQDTFGHLYGEFWLGLKYIKEIAAQGATEIRLDLSDGFGRHGYEAFQDFRLSGDNEYTLHILEESRSFSGGIEQFQNASNGLAGNNGNVFAAMSGFLPTDYYRRCPVDEKSGWWYDYYCGGVDLNGPYLTPGTLWNESTGDKTPGFKHFGFAGNYSLKASRMMIRRK